MPNHSRFEGRFQPRLRPPILGKIPPQIAAHAKVMNPSVRPSLLDKKAKKNASAKLALSY
jgi:hypothetical protein